METYGKILLIAMPAFLFLILFEKFYGWYRGKDTVRNMDMISSLTSGVTNVTKDVIGLYFIILSYPFFLEHLSFMTVSSSIIVYIIAFINLDFAGYWVHRIQHEINLFWNGHIIHHSSEEYNLACALRQSISSIVKIFTIFLLPAALFGVPANVIAIVAPLHLFAQFWYHTQHINKMGFLEKIIVTPSHHRVHHAINKEYIDKNYGQIFIFWDKWFGTFQPELPDVPPVYGITIPVHTWNPIKINFLHVWLLMKDAWSTKIWKDKFFLWFRHTGYRPTDITSKYPVYKIEDIYHFKKYDTKTSLALNVWCWFQLLVIFLFVSYLFGNIASINNIDINLIYYYGAFIFLTVYALSELMDRNRFVIIWETIKNASGLLVIYFIGDWFGSDIILSPSLKYVIVTYFLVSESVTVWFVLKHSKEDKFIPIQTR